MTKITRVYFVVVLALMLLVLPTSAQDENLQEETLLMTFIPNIQFAPVYVAMEAGYFGSAGFDVNLEYLDEPQVVDLVAADENQFGIVSGEQVILASAQARPIVYVYEWFQEFPIGIVYSDAMAVEGVGDLQGMRIGIPGRFGATYSGFTTLLESAGIPENDMLLEEIGFAAPEVFCVGAVDASVIYVNNEPLQIRNRASQGDCGDVTGIDVLQISDVVDLVSNGIITNQDMVSDNPETVAAFIQAFDAGLRLSINNPARAYLLSAPQIDGLPAEDTFIAELEALADEQDAFLATDPDQSEIRDSRIAQYQTLVTKFPADQLLQYEVLLASIELWEGDQLGFTAEDSWENMRETLVSLGQLDEAVSLEALYTNAFLPDGD